MSSAGLFILIAVGVGVLAFVLWPLVFGGVRDPNTSHSARALHDQREAILDAIRVLDFDFQTGKIIEDEYRLQRASLVTHGADILRQIDERG